MRANSLIIGSLKFKLVDSEWQDSHFNGIQSCDQASAHFEFEGHGFDLSDFLDEGQEIGASLCAFAQGETVGFQA